MKKIWDWIKRVDSNSYCKHRKMVSSERYSYNPTLRWNPQVEEYFIKAYGAEHFSVISKALTRPSCYSCIRVNTLRSTNDGVIEKLRSFLKESQIKNCVEDEVGENNDCIFLSKSDKREFDHYLHPNICNKLVLELCEDVKASQGNLENMTIYKSRMPAIDNIVLVKGSGPHTIQYDDVLNQPLKEVIISRKCAEAVLRGAQVFVPGVLACSAHVEKGDKVAVSVAIEQPGSNNGWTVGFTRGTVLQGSQTDPHYFERAGLYIGKGRAMMSRAGIFRASEGVAIEMINRVYNLPSFNDALEGEIFLQNLPSIITAHVLDPQEGEKILDMCAAPGGKTTAIAILMRDKGEVVAVDRSHNKVLGIKKLAAEMGLSCITAYKLDALKSVFHPREAISILPEVPQLPDLLGEDKIITAKLLNTTKPYDRTFSNEKSKGQPCCSKTEDRKNARKKKNGPGRNHDLGGRVEKSEGFASNSFDRVLLDAPCSALGLRPRLFSGEESLESLRNHGKYQRRMFDQAVQLVRSGGVIVYSTCTINPGENEGLVRYALDTYKFLSLAMQSPKIGGPGFVGNFKDKDGRYTEEWLRKDEADLVQRFDPSSPLDTIGFFIAKFNVGQKES